MMFATELQGRCKRDGTSVLITKTVRLAVAATPYATVPVPLFSLEPGILGSNGHNDAQRA